MAMELHRAWLFTAAGDDRGHGGNMGYDDQVDAYYSWDDLVPNHKQVRRGDLVAVWDKKTLLGVSVIEDLVTEPGIKTLHRCPHCGTTRISPRKRESPRYRCAKCRKNFGVPVVENREVMTYKARYDAGWSYLEASITAQEVRSLARSARERNAIRAIDWGKLEELLRRHSAELALRRLNARVRVELYPESRTGESLEFTHGFRETMVRVRRGQARFRASLLASQGSVCAFTGDAPAKVLEAGHLYSYAEIGTHYDFGGLMLRRDIHRLFDDGDLAVEPDSLRVDVGPRLRAFPNYAQLAGRRLVVPLHESQIRWLEQHWRLHRADAR